MRDLVMDAVRTHFRPEFLNRVDEIIIFHQLSREEIKEIVEIQIERLKARLQDRHLDVELTERAKDLLVDEGYDPTYGARPLKRTIQRRILDPLALKVLQGEFREGETILVDAEGGDFVFRHEPVAVAA